MLRKPISGSRFIIREAGRRNTATQGVRVNAIAPGWIESDMLHRAPARGGLARKQNPLAPRLWAGVVNQPKSILARSPPPILARYPRDNNSRNLAFWAGNPGSQARPKAITIAENLTVKRLTDEGFHVRALNQGHNKK